MPRTRAHLEFLMNALLQNLGSLAVLHLHFPLLRHDPGFLIGQSFSELLGDLCLLLSPSKGIPEGISSCGKLKVYITMLEAETE